MSHESAFDWLPRPPARQSPGPLSPRTRAEQLRRRRRMSMILSHAHPRQVGPGRRRRPGRVGHCPSAVPASNFRAARRQSSARSSWTALLDALLEPFTGPLPHGLFQHRLRLPQLRQRLLTRPPDSRPACRSPCCSATSRTPASTPLSFCFRRRSKSAFSASRRPDCCPASSPGTMSRPTPSCRRRKVRVRHARQRPEHSIAATAGTAIQSRRSLPPASSPSRRSPSTAAGRCRGRRRPAPAAGPRALAARPGPTSR